MKYIAEYNNKTRKLTISCNGITKSCFIDIVYSNKKNPELLLEEEKIRNATNFLLNLCQTKIKQEERKEKKPTARSIKLKLQNWLDTDMVKGTFICHYIEKNDPAFIRGVRYGLYQAIRELDNL